MKKPKIYWQYRVTKTTVNETECFEIREFHFKDGEQTGYSTEPSHPVGETLDELKASFELMTKAFYLPTIEIPPGIPG